MKNIDTPASRASKQIPCRPAASATGESTVARTALEIEVSQAEQKIISNLKLPDETKVEFMRHLLNIVDMHPEGFINGHFSVQKKEQDLPDPRPIAAPDKLVEEEVVASDVQKSDGFDEIERFNINLNNLSKFL